MVCCQASQATVSVSMQGLPEGHTEACYPVLRPGVDSHKAPPLKDSDAEKREVHAALPRPALFLKLFCCLSKYLKANVALQLVSF